MTPLCVSTRTTRLFAANGIEGSIHRCRHTYATRLLRAGVNIRVVQELMRHKSLASTQIYTAVDEVERRDGIDRLGAGAGAGAGVVGVEGRSFRTEASAANYVARKAREARAREMTAALDLSAASKVGAL